MQDVFGDAGQAHPAAGSTAVESELALLIDVYGLALLDEPERIHLLLVQACPDATRWIGAILTALRAQVPQRLRIAKNDENLPAVLQGAVQHVQEQGSLDPAWAAWAVRAWAHVLALPTSAIGSQTTAAPGRPGEPEGGAAPGSGGPDETRATDRRGKDRREPTGVVPSQRARDEVDERTERWPETATGYEMPVRETRRGGGAARREPLFESGSALPDGPAVDAGGARGIDAAGPASPGEPPSPYRDPGRLPDPGPHPMERAREDANRGVRPDARASNDPSQAAGPLGGIAAAPKRFPPPAAAGSSFAPPLFTPQQRERSKSFGRPIFLGAVLVAVAVAIFFGANYERRTAVPAAGTSPPTTAGDTTPAVGSPASEPARTAGGGPSNAVAPTTPAPAPAPSSVERAPVAAASVAPSPVPSAPSSGAPQAVVPAQAAPAPSAAPRPAIAQVEVPRVVEGDPFALVVRLRGDGRDVASIERRIVESGGGWPEADASTRRIAVPPGSTSLRVPFRAMDAPAHATVEFTAIGRDGSRGVPMRAAVSVAGPARIGADVPATGACTRSTCGTVTGSYEVSPEAGTRAAVYRVRVGMDDGQEQSFTAPYRLQNGSRVRKAGDRFVPDGSGSR